jgi:excisionase family DNA binding protein
MTPPPVMTIEEVADFLRLPVRTLYHWRQTGDGPQPRKVGRHLRYRRSDVEAWLDAQATTPVATRRPLRRLA